MHAGWTSQAIVLELLGRDGKLAEWWLPRPTWGQTASVYLGRYLRIYLGTYLSDKEPAAYELLPADLGPKKKREPKQFWRSTPASIVCRPLQVYTTPNLTPSLLGIQPKCRQSTRKTNRMQCSPLFQSMRL